MFAALEDCIKGYKSLYSRTDMFQFDVSISNLMMNEDEDNPSWGMFFIDLDLTIKEQQDEPSGAQDKTEMRAFMAIGVLLDKKHSFIYDLESFF